MGCAGCAGTCSLVTGCTGAAVAAPCGIEMLITGFADDDEDAGLLDAAAGCRCCCCCLLCRRNLRRRDGVLVDCARLRATPRFALFLLSNELIFDSSAAVGFLPLSHTI